MNRNLILSGFMATGKSTVGRVVAERQGVEFVDLDELVEQRVGAKIPEIFARDGEASFRRVESVILREELERQPRRVIAVGGGALMRRALRLEVLERCVVVTLEGRLEELLRRAAADGDTRPLLSEQSRAAAELLLEQREAAYAEAHERIQVDGREIDSIAAEVVGVWQADPVGVAVGMDSYSVEIGDTFAEARLAPALMGSSSAVVITDDIVDGLYGDGVRDAMSKGSRVGTFRMVPGEEYKTPDTLASIWTFLLNQGCDRKSRIVGLGGGVATDVAGFAAATWMRGIPWVSMPTTLLGMVDASVGGKTAVDLPEAKNCVGAFWQPARVLCDTRYLASESERRFRSGMAEVVKTALLGDAELFALLEREHGAVASRNAELVERIVRSCIVVKSRIVSLDTREAGQRAALNLGHTVGHALESLGGYGHLTHGEAVSLGLVAALKIGVELKVTPIELLERTVRLLGRLGLPTDLSAQPLSDAAQLLGNDKKRGGSSVRFVLCSEPGVVRFESLELPALQKLTCELA